MNWKFCPASTPWMNGCAEAMIKSVKKAILHAIGNHILTFPEKQTIMFEAANLINERPIGKHLTDSNEGSYLAPNDLILGRASSMVSAAPFSEQCTLRQRYEFIQSLVNSLEKMDNSLFSLIGDLAYIKEKCRS